MIIFVRMRDDLAEEELSIPASRTFKNYDTLVDELYISAEELEGAFIGNDPADPDDHPFCFVELRDGRCLYFMSVDLDFTHSANSLAEDALDCACAEIQRQLGVKTGDLAGLIFSGEKGDEVRNIFKQYIQAELAHREEAHEVVTP